MKYNWKFVQKGKGVNFMFCEGNKLIIEFQNKHMDYALKQEDAKIKKGHKISPTIVDYIKQCNEKAGRWEIPSRNPIPVISITDWNRLQKEAKPKKTK